SAWFPSLSANATYTRLDDDRILAGTPPRVLQPADSFNGNLQLVVPIVQPRAWVASARAKDTVELTRFAAADVRVQVAVATGRAYLTVVTQKRLLASAVQARDTAKAHEDFTNQRFSGGVGNRLDYVRASQERATSEAQVHAQRIALVRSQEALGVLVG